MKTNNILKNTLKFMVSFIIITILFFVLLGLLFFTNPGSMALPEYLPISKNFDVEDLNWDKISKIGGYGVLIDSDGNVIKSFNAPNDKEKYTSDEILDILASNKSITDIPNLSKDEKTSLVYSMKDGNRLLLIYPSDIINRTINVQLNKVRGERFDIFIFFLIGILILYILALFYIVRRLSKSLKRDLDAIRKEEEARKDELFRGLAHDIKTPLSSILAFSNALADGIVNEGEEQKYYEGIHKNGKILNDRINDMLELSVLTEEGMYNPKEGDILEFIRRYVGDNYIWYTENDAEISLEYEEEEKYLIGFDPKLFERVLQNILQNSVYHNEGPVKISIDFDDKNRKLIFKDDGKGIKEELVENIFDPMVTGDESRTGEKLRGMGLANVKRIVELHGWDIKYDNGFVIKIKDK